MSASVSSTFTVGPAQADGRQPVTEIHTADDGREFRYEYLNADLDPQMVMEERATIINAELAKREAARAAVTGTEVPYTKFEFLSRFTDAERIAIRAYAKTTNPYAANLDDFMEMLSASGGVYMAKARPGIALLAALGIGGINSTRAAELSVP